MRNSRSLIITVCFCAFLGGILLVSLFLPKRSFSSLENRYLQKTPSLSVRTLQNGDFMEDVETYAADHIAWRDMWVKFHALTEKICGKNEIGGIFLAKSNTLIKHIDPPADAEMDARADYVSSLSGSLDIPVYFGLIPSAAEIWSDRLPENAVCADESADIVRIGENTTAISVDILSALTSHADEEVFYRTDHHWTSLGAFYGADALLRGMGQDGLDINDYTPVTVSDDFFGTTYSSSCAFWVKPDHIERYVPDDSATVTHQDGAKIWDTGLYKDECLDTKDKYSYFLGGNQPLCIVKSDNTDGKKILLIRDSYSDSLTPFIAERFSEIHLIDLRYYRTSIREYIDENEIDAVVVLYGYSTFVSDGNLFLLGR